MERLLIGSLELTTTTTGLNVAALYSSDTRLKYPVATLFDLSALTDVNIDPNTLTPDQRHHARFYAYYEYSERTNSAGNRYRDITHLEPIAAPATAASTDTTAILAELRAMRAAIDTLAKQMQSVTDLLCLAAPPPPTTPTPIATATAPASPPDHDTAIPADYPRGKSKLFKT